MAARVMGQRATEKKETAKGEQDKEERKNSKFDIVATRNFNDFIEDAGLHEFSLRDRKFTFCSGKKLSRIDRIMVSWCFLNKWPNAGYRALAREKSDHCPLLLKVCSKNFGPKPFWFFNSWLDKPDFQNLVTTSIMDFSGEGVPDLNFIHKLRELRSKIVEWRQKQKALDSEEEDCLKKEITDLELAMEVRELLDEEVWVFEEAKKKLGEFLKVKDLKQKARVKWAKDGDENS
ncbi:uncharacterized protein LOC110886249 [Helianthus annuus]|uniref:uncharacterized protein LOC110886249 n=1 Tax=Helianthus annuus TaxID=4232 RepID=UPI000B9033E6|nr:uncharacterized protein LOC110886249 [Helianthus annuus]